MFVASMLQNIFQCLPASCPVQKVLVPGFLAFLLLLIEVPSEMSLGWNRRVSKLHRFFVYLMCFFGEGTSRVQSSTAIIGTWLVVLFVFRIYPP